MLPMFQVGVFIKDYILFKKYRREIIKECDAYDTLRHLKPGTVIFHKPTSKLMKFEQLCGHPHFKVSLSSSENSPWITAKAADIKEISIIEYMKLKRNQGDINEITNKK